jgi:hypothetical protein
VRFQSKGKPKGQILVREQRRITLTIVGVGLLVFFLIASGRSAWIAGLFSDPPPVARTLPRISEALLGQNNLLPDEIDLVPPEASAETENYAAMIDKSGAAQMEAVVIPDSSAIGDVPQTLTRLIRDDVIGVLSSETQAWFGTLRLAEKIPSGDYYQVPEGQFALFMDSPQSCRGKPFLIRGRLQRLLKAPLPESAETFGIRSAYDAWISTRDSGNQLVHVVALSADASLPRQLYTPKSAPDVELTGYFFKREGYAAKGADGQGDLALTPLILAGKIRYIAPKVVVTRADEMNPWLAWIGVAVCFGVLVIVWQFHNADSVFRGTRTHQLTSPPVRPSFDGVSAVTIEEILRDMQTEAQQSSPDTRLIT